MRRRARRRPALLLDLRRAGLCFSQLKVRQFVIFVSRLASRDTGKIKGMQRPVSRRAVVRSLLGAPFLLAACSSGADVQSTPTDSPPTEPPTETPTPQPTATPTPLP